MSFPQKPPTKGTHKKWKHAKWRARTLDVLQRTYGDTTTLGHGPVRDAKQATAATVLILSPFSLDEAHWLGAAVLGGGS